VLTRRRRSAKPLRSGPAVARWKKQIEDLFVACAASRAARSLREAGEAQQRSDLRRANARGGEKATESRSTTEVASLGQLRVEGITWPRAAM